MMKGKKMGSCLRCSYEFQKKFKIRFFLLFVFGVGVFFASFVSAGKGDYNSTFGDDGGSASYVPSGNGSKVVGTPDTGFSSSRSSSDSSKTSKEPKGSYKWAAETNGWDKEDQTQENENKEPQKQPAKKEKKTPSEIGINVDPDCLVNGGCSFSIYDALDIRKDRAVGERTSVMTFLNDIILGLTWFIGTVVAVALLFSGFYYIISPVDSGAKKNAATGMKYALIGLVVVSMSVVIIRLIQFLASGGT